LKKLKKTEEPYLGNLFQRPKGQESVPVKGNRCGVGKEIYRGDQSHSSTRVGRKVADVLTSWGEEFGDAEQQVKESRRQGIKRRNGDLRKGPRDILANGKGRKLGDTV